MITEFNKFGIPEKEDIDLSKFLVYCKPFLDEMRKYYTKDNFEELYRGMDLTALFSNGKLMTANKHRTPKDVILDVHNIANDMFNEKFGWNVRNGTFATSDYSVATGYGRPHIFFPVGNFEFVYSNYIDDFTEISIDIEDKLKEQYFKGRDEAEQKERFIREELWDKLFSFKDDNLKNAIDSENEISFNCEQYYLFKDNMTGKLIDAIYDNKV